MSDIEMKRAYVADLYPGPGWKAKVKKMPDPQVFAIYMRETSKPKNDKPKESGSGGTGGEDIPF